MQNPEMKLSIIVPAYNAEDTLERCLAAIFVAVGAAQDCEVIVVDDGSTDHTAQIARRFPVHLLRSERNEGRLRAREKGARAARAATLLFVDARVLLPDNALAVLETLNYEPVMGGTATLNVQDGAALDRLLYLIRRRIYAPYYPQSEAFPVIKLTPHNFARTPKGMGALLIDKARFLAALPEDRSHFVNDDTRVLAEVVKRKEVWVSRDLAIVYLHRQDPWAAYCHIYERGPRFADFHLRPGGQYYPLWVLCCLVALAVVIGAALAPEVALGAAAGIFLVLAVVSVRLAEKPGDVFRTLAVLPVAATLFGLGILQGKLRQFFHTPDEGMSRFQLRPTPPHPVPLLRGEREPRLEGWRKHLTTGLARGLALVVILAAAVGYVVFNRDTFSHLRVTHWELLPLLAGLQLAFLAVNGLSLKVVLEIFAVRLRPAEWFGLAVVTAMGSYVASGVGGVALRAAILKHRFAVSYTQFVSILTASYLLNSLVAALLGLGACAAYYAEAGFWRWEFLGFFAAVGGAASAVAVLHPVLPTGTGRVHTLVRGVYEGWDALRRHPKVLGKVTLLLTVNFLLQALTLVVGFALFAVPLDAPAALLIAVLSSFSIFFALTPANLGIQEGLIALLSHMVGYGFQHGLAVAAVTRAVSMITIFTVGPFFSHRLLRRAPWAASSGTN